MIFQWIYISSDFQSSIHLKKHLEECQCQRLISLIGYIFYFFSPENIMHEISFTSAHHSHVVVICSGVVFIDHVQKSFWEVLVHMVTRGALHMMKNYGLNFWKLSLNLKCKPPNFLLM